jgi:hypothetical protein
MALSRIAGAALLGATVMTVTPGTVAAQPTTASAVVTEVACASSGGERRVCPADTSRGVVLKASTGASPCLLGRTWGYDATGIWVTDGCGGTFVVGQQVSTASVEAEKNKASPEYIPNLGFRIYEGEKGQIYVRLFSYVRYLNQKGLDPSYTDSFGNSHTVKQREDIQLNKLFVPFYGWFLTPKLHYYLYIWSSNPSQGEGAQVVGGGNLNYTFNEHITLGGGIASLPTTRSTEGQFPYWLGMDDRLIADEFFRGSYSSGIWLKGEFATKFRYMAMIADNLSQLGVSAAQMDNILDTTSFMLQWLPTTGEFGLHDAFGDFDFHDKLATRLGAHYTHSTEDRQSQPDTNGIENSQIRLTDGNVIFTPGLFGSGITVNTVKYQMVSVDAGLKYKGLSLEAEYYWRWLSDFRGTNVAGVADIDDHGFQVQASAMVVPRVLQAYLGGSAIRGRYGDGSEVRAGLNWYLARERELKLNPEWIHLNECPVGYTAVPYPVGGNGDVFHVNFMMSF